MQSRPNTGVDTITGRGLAEVLTGAQVIVDVSNSPPMDSRLQNLAERRDQLR